MSIFKIIIKELDKQDDEVVVNFDNNEIALLNDYLVEYRRFSQCKPLQQRLPCKMSINFSKDNGLNVNSEFPLDDDFALMLHRMRPFILQEEPTSFTNTTALVGKRLSHPVFRQYLRAQRRLWDGRDFQTNFPIILNGARLNPEKLFSDWLNGFEYHREIGRANSLRELREQMFSGITELMITNHALNKIRAVRNISFLLGLFVGEIRELKFEFYLLTR